jgi:hypothetical protein
VRGQVPSSEGAFQVWSVASPPLSLSLSLSLPGHYLLTRAILIHLLLPISNGCIHSHALSLSLSSPLMFPMTVFTHKNYHFLSPPLFPVMVFFHMNCLQPSCFTTYVLSVPSPPPPPPYYATSLQICQVVPTMPMQHHHQQSSHQHIQFRQQQQHGRHDRLRHDRLRQSVEVDELRNPALV